MSSRALPFCLTASLLFACRPDPPTLPAARCPPAFVEPVEDRAGPAPEPSCKTLAEQCVSDDGTELALAHRRVLYRPPRGWQFARSADSVVVVAQEGQAAVAFRFATGERANQLIPELERLVKDLGIEGVNFATLRGRLRMPQHESKDGLLPLRLWEVSSNHQGGVAPRLDTAGDGTLLVVEAKLEDGRAVVGAAFVADTAANLATLIMNSLRSLQLEPSGAKPGLSPDASDR